MAKSNSKTSASFFANSAAMLSPQKVHNFHPKKTPENKKSALVPTSPTAGNKMVTPQTVRLTNLEQRLKDRHNRANSFKYGGYQVQQP